MSEPRFPRPERKGVFFVAWSDKTAFYLIKVNSEWQIYRVQLPLPPNICGRWECTLTHWQYYSIRGVFDWLDHATEEEVTKYVLTHTHKRNG